MDYQMAKAVGKSFRSADGQVIGYITILGIPYTFQVVGSEPRVGDMLEIFAFEQNRLLVRVNNLLTESDVNFVGY